MRPFVLAVRATCRRNIEQCSFPAKIKKNRALSYLGLCERILWDMIGTCVLICVGFAVNLCSLLSNVFRALWCQSRAYFLKLRRVKITNCRPVTPVIFNFQFVEHLTILYTFFALCCHLMNGIPFTGGDEVVSVCVL